MAIIQRAAPKALSEIAGASLTGSYQDVYTASDDVIILVVTNTCDQDIYISLDGGTTTHLKLSSDNKGFVLDYSSNLLRLPKPTVSVKHAGVLPSGWLAVSATELTT